MNVKWLVCIALVTAVFCGLAAVRLASDTGTFWGPLFIGALGIGWAMRAGYHLRALLQKDESHA